MNIEIGMLTPGTQVLSVDEAVKFEDVDGSENEIACHADITVRRASEGIYIHAELKGVFDTPCHECLEPAKCLLEPSFDVVAKKIPAGSQGHAEETDDDFIYITAEDRDISLDRYVYEHLLASMPIRILCREDCKGLCPGCGANLNAGECRCSA
jgi:uncharacterized protein